MKTPLISIIIPTYNRAEMLHGAIESLINQETDGRFSFEILIINDASTDGTIEVIKKLMTHFQGVVKYVQGEGKGYTSALNRGIAEARGDWVALFDDDELAEPNWLKELFSFAEDIGAYSVGGRRILALPEDSLSQLGPIAKGMLGDDFSSYNNQKYQPTRNCHSRSIPIGGNMLVKRSVFDAIGMFDESMLTGGCDRDLSLRILDAGLIQGLTPKAVVYHRVSPQRITPEHMKWYSLQFGNSFAYIDWKRSGKWRTITACLGRLLKALFVHIPLLIVSYIKANQTEIQDRKILLWRIVGYAAKILSLLAPGLIPQKRFFQHLEFRKERETRSRDSKVSG